METKQKQKDMVDLLFRVGRIIWITLIETIPGIFQNRVPARFTYPGILLAVFFTFKLDVDFLALIGSRFQIADSFRNSVIYASLLSGWFIWGLARAGERSRLLGKLRAAFESAQLKCNGRYPSLIEDVAIDHRVRKLRLLCHGVPKSDFEKEIGRLESVLNMTVVRVSQDDGDKSKIELLYTMKDLEKHLVLENPADFVDGEIPIGLTYDGDLHVNMRDVGHILVAGQTGGGKSNFLKVATTVLTKNNPKGKVVFLDFKGGMETADLRNHAKNLGDNITCFDGTKRCIEELIRIGMALEARFVEISSVGASNFDDYMKKNGKIAAAPGQTLRPTDERRTFLIIDEIAQLYSNEPGVSKEEVDRARAAVNRIARQGRAAGMHLIVATQRPDTKSFDQTMKANLPAILCFPMANQAASVSALGTKRAFEINPNIKGRAVWKFGPKLEEVQTYLFT